MRHAVRNQEHKESQMRAYALIDSIVGSDCDKHVFSSGYCIYLVYVYRSDRTHL